MLGRVLLKYVRKKATVFWDATLCSVVEIQMFQRIWQTPSSVNLRNVGQSVQDYITQQPRSQTPSHLQPSKPQISHVQKNCCF